MAAFDRYRDELLEWNQRLNLTAIKQPAAVERLHFLDSLACLLEPIAAGSRVLDVGAGAGLPGLALAIARPDLQVCLLEATGKKAKFLEHVASVLGLSGVDVVNDRAETAAHTDLREAFEVVLARALAAMPALLELTLPFCWTGGKLLAMKKGAGLTDELTSAAQALTTLGGEFAPSHTYELDGEQRQIVVIRKLRPTPAAYPRRPGVPVKNPL